jgi:hypothetical protein
MDEVSSHVCLNLPFNDKAADKIVLPRLESHDGTALVPIPKRSASP